MFAVDNDISGTCCACIIYDLGVAHGCQHANDQAEWDNWTISVRSKLSQVIVAFSNWRQTGEREYMTVQGWTHQSVGPDGMIVSTIDRDKLDDYLQGVQEQIKAKQEELKRIETERVSKFKKEEPKKPEPVAVKKRESKKTVDTSKTHQAGGQAVVQKAALLYAPRAEIGKTVTLVTRHPNWNRPYWITTDNGSSYWEADLEPV